MVRDISLEQYATRMLRPPSASSDLMEQLIGALSGPQIAPRQAKIRIHHPDQSKEWKMMPLGDDLGSDDEIDLEVLDSRNEICCLSGSGHRIAGDDFPRNIGKERRRLFSDPLDPRPLSPRAVSASTDSTGITVGVAYFWMTNCTNPKAGIGIQ